MQKGRIFKMTKTNRFCIRPKFKRSLFILFLWRYSRTYCRHSNRQVLGTLTRLNMLSALQGPHAAEWIHPYTYTAGSTQLQVMPKHATLTNTEQGRQLTTCMDRQNDRKCYFWSRPVIWLAAKNREFQDTYLCKACAESKAMK